MTSFLNRPFYIPKNLKLELKSYLNGYIFWISSFLHTFKTSDFIHFGLKPVHETHQIFLNRQRSYSSFYKLCVTPLKKQNKKFGAEFYTELNQNIISSLTGYRKFLTIKGIGYKFTLKNNLLFLDAGYSHVLFFTWNKLFQGYFSRKLKSMYLRNRNLNILTTYLAKIKRKRPINVYTRKGIRYSQEILKYKEGKRRKSF